ncbi:bromodomain containing protein [Aphelenchoides avenae]|nr:bromodomain containing protein [Aphelenchus avenae]
MKHSSEHIVPVDLDGKTCRINSKGEIFTADPPAAKSPSTPRASKNAEKVEVPVAKFIVIEDEDEPDNRRQVPSTYVRYSGKECVSNSACDRDHTWLKLANQRRQKNGQTQISERLFEEAIDLLEKESHFEVVENGPAPRELDQTVEDDVPCSICHEREDSNVNQIIFCDMCNIAVHQECYGVPYIPEGQWACRRCQLSPSEPVQCALCAYTGGAFKQTSEGKWAHVMCALWLNEVHFANGVFLEPIDGVEFSLKRRSKLRCLVCSQKVGACVQCSKRSCYRAFHVTCAQFSGMKMTVQPQTTKSGEIVINRFVFCHQHSVSGNEVLSKKKIGDKIKHARKMLTSTSRAIPNVLVPVIAPTVLDKIRKKLLLDSVEDVRNYWAMKRRARCGVPLIRRLQVYQKKVPVKKVNEFSAEGGADGSSLQPEVNTLFQLRRNLEKVRLLSELVKKREKIKKEHIYSCCDTFERSMKPESELMREALDKMVAKDHQKVFLEPVSEAAVPGYRAIIKKPMDLSTMRKKVNTGQYTSLDGFNADFLLMVENCATFNKDNKYYWDYGQRFRGMGTRIVQQARAELERINAASKFAKAAANTSMQKDGQFYVGADTYLANIEGWTKSEGSTKAVASVASTKKKNQLRNAPFEPYAKPKKALKLASDGPSADHGTPSQSSARKRAYPPSATPDAKKLLPTARHAYRNYLEGRRESRLPVLGFGEHETNGIETKETPSVPIIPTARRNKPKPAMIPQPPVPMARRSLRPSPPPQPLVSTPHRGLRRTKSPLKESFRHLRPTTRLGDLTEMSSASDTGGFTSADEDLSVSIVPSRKSKRLSLSSTGRNSFTDIEPDGAKYVHDDIIWVTLSDGQRMPAHVVDIGWQGAIGEVVPEFYSKVVQQRPASLPSILVVLFDRDDSWTARNSWQWLPLERVIGVCNPEAKENGAGQDLNAALQRARKFYHEKMKDDT